jgi:rhamnulokinase
MGVEAQQPVTTDQALALEFTNEAGVDGTIRLQKNVTGLWVIQECVRQWRQTGRQYTWAEVVALARQTDPLRSVVDPDASDFLAPENMPDAIRAYCCRTGQPRPETDGEFARCCFESLALKYRSVLEALKSLTGRELNTIRVVGGGSSNPLLCQLTADACGCPVIAGPVEASSLGNVMVQAVATGCLSSIAQGRESIAASCELVTYEPVPSEQWGSACERFRRLEERQCFHTSQA